MPPSARIAGPTHTLLATVGGATHVHVLGQSAAVAHVIVLAWQCDVEDVMVMHVGGEPASTLAGGSGPASIGCAGSAGEAMLGGEAEAPPPVLDEPTVADPADPLPAQTVLVSGTQAKSGPQSELTAQGRS